MNRAGADQSLCRTSVIGECAPRKRLQGTGARACQTALARVDRMESEAIPDLRSARAAIPQGLPGQLPFMTPTLLGAWNAALT